MYYGEFENSQLPGSLYDRMKTRLDIQLKTASAVAFASIDMIATTVEQLLQLQVFNLPNAADLSENLETKP